LLNQPGFSLARREEAEQIEQVFCGGERLCIGEPAKFFPAHLSKSLTRPQPAGDGRGLLGGGTG
jgi:hypothetical protein